MKHPLLALTFVLLSASVASAQSLKLPTTIFLASAAADWSSTAYCFTKPGCTETNPMLNWAKPLGAPTMIGIGAASDVVTLYVAHRLIGKRHPRVLTVALYALSAVRVGVTIQNLREARH